MSKEKVEHILLFIECSEPGGAEQVVYLLAIGLRNIGLQVTVLCLELGWLTNKLEQNGIKPIVMKSRLKYDFTLPFRIAQVIKNHNIDVIHSHLLDSNFYGSLAARIAGVHHVATDHGDVHLPGRKKLLRFKLTLSSWLGSHYTAVSKFTQKHLRENGVRNSKLSCLYNPIVFNDKDFSISREQLRSSVGIVESTQDSHWVWLHVGALKPVKDQELLLNGFAKALKLTNTKQSLWIVGDGPKRSELEALVTQLQIEPHVIFFGVRDDVPVLLAASDGFILSSVSEAMPMSILEAAASNLFLVSSDVGGISEIIDEGKTGRLFRAGDDVALSLIIKEALEDPLRSRQMAKRARDLMKKSFSLDLVLKGYKKLYESH